MINNSLYFYWPALASPRYTFVCLLSVALGGQDGDLNAGGWKSGPKDSKNI